MSHILFISPYYPPENGAASACVGETCIKKMYEAMACAWPVVLAVEGDARRIAEEAGAAMCVEPENPSALAYAILHLHEHPNLASVLGPKGRAYVEARFDYDHLTSVLDARIAMLLDERNSKSDRYRENTNTAAASPLR